jgi:hypothetical protein
MYVDPPQTGGYYLESLREPRPIVGRQQLSVKAVRRGA